MKGGNGVTDEVGTLHVRRVHGLLALIDPHLFFHVNCMTQKLAYNGMFEVHWKSIGYDSAPTAPVLPSYDTVFFQTEIGFDKSAVTTYQILFRHATFPHSENFCGSPNKILIYETKKLDHVLWWLVINIHIYKKVMR
jgi:hypothetical protein